MLTGLANRVAFDLRCNDLIPHAIRRKQVLLFAPDLDRFKDVNDTLGHQAGDLLLRETGARIREVSCGSDFAARFGRDEFALLVLHPPLSASGGALADKLLRALEKPFMVGGLLWSNLPGHLNRWKIHHLRSNTWQQKSERYSIPA